MAGTAFDFREATAIGDAIQKKPEGFDDVFLMHSDEQKQLVLSDAGSGREMALSSNRSSIVLFSTTDMNEPYLVNGRPMRSQLRLGDRGAGSAGCHPPSGLGQYRPGAKYFGGKGSKLHF